jgi:two-component system cell cycle sensor histidine kinase/response regulator CckA
LATVFGIVQQAGGTIGVESAPGRGTTFLLEFPHHMEAPMAPAEPAAEGTRPRPVHGCGRSVLLVEDEDAVRKLARIALESQGYSVIEAVDAEGALEQLTADTQLDLLVTDLTMPGMDGQELAERIRTERPAVGVVFISGYISDPDDLDRFAGALVLAKPFTPNQLLAAANTLLSSASATGMELVTG